MAFTTTTGAGGTSLIGTSGVDTLGLTGGNSFPVYIGAQAANDVIVFESAATYASIRAELGKGADSFTTEVGASLSASTISGNFGNDIINISAGSTITGSSALVNGNQGVDTINVGGTVTKGARILGGADNDILAITGTVSEGAVINGNKGDDKIDVAVGGIVNNSTIFGGEGNDTMAATNGAVVFSGDIGNDTITGSTATDKLYGGDGNDTISASAAIIDDARDTLSGGAGADTFKFVGNNPGNVPNVPYTTVNIAGASADLITDFTVAEDKINTGTAAAFGGVITSDAAFLAAGTLYAVSGTYTAGSNPTFVAKAFGDGGFDTLIVVGDANNTTTVDETKTLAVLQGVNASTLAVSNFVA